MDDSKCRTVKLTVRLSVSEHQALQSFAYSARLPLAEFLRKAGLNKSIKPAAPAVPELNRHAYVQLGSLAANFEKLVPLLTTPDAIAIIEKELKEVVVHAIATTQALRTTLIQQTRP